jgi:hypothetical protein
MDLLCGRVILDQLDQLVGEHDLAPRRRDRLADQKIVLIGCNFLGMESPHQVAAPVLPAQHKILTTALERGPWRPEWVRWLAARSGEPCEPPRMGMGAEQDQPDAPGAYIHL